MNRGSVKGLFGRSVFAGAAIVALLFAVGVSSSQADPITYVLNVSGGTNFNQTTYGEVQLLQVGAGDVQVTVNLYNGNLFVNTGLEESFDFNLTGISGNIAVTGLTGAWALSANNPGGAPATPPANSMDGFGTFEYALVCCSGQGGGNAVAGPLVFHVLATGLTTDSFLQLSTDGGFASYFAVDIYAAGTNGATGAVGTDGATTPEPGSLILLGSGLMGAVTMVRMRRRSKRA